LPDSCAASAAIVLLLLLLLQVSPPFEVAEFDILFGEGINSVGCTFDVAKETGVIETRVSSSSSSSGRRHSRAAALWCCGEVELAYVLFLCCVSCEHN
jgi:hypothetical protein